MPTPIDRPDESPAPKPEPKTPRRRNRPRVGADPKRTHTFNWPLRSAQQRQRLGQWFLWTRKTRLHMSLRALSDAAAQDGVDLSTTAIRGIEAMAESVTARRRLRVNLENIHWLAAYSGQSLADLGRMLEGGDWSQVGGAQDAAPSAEALADRVRALLLTLPPARQRAVADFAAHERFLEDRDLQLAQMTQATQSGKGYPTPLMPGETASAPDSGTQALLDSVAQAQQAVREAQRTLDAQTGAGASERPEDDSQGHSQRRRTSGQ